MSQPNQIGYFDDSDYFFGLGLGLGNEDQELVFGICIEYWFGAMVYILAKNPYLFPPPTFSWPANLP